ncbi:MAG: Fe-S cluster assembly protein IscX [Bdellovibrionales bacterium]
MAGKPPPSPPDAVVGRRLRRSPWRTSSRTQARFERRSVKWVDVERIGQLLFKYHPDIDPELSTNDELQKLIISLPPFNDSPHPPNGLYVDLIRDSWLDSRNQENTTQTRTATD